jgi:serine O-acetyltransferase
MFENIKSDLLRNCHIVYGKPSFINKCRVVLNSMGFHAVIVYRLGRWSYTKFNGKPFFLFRYLFLAIHYCLSRLIVKMYGIEIDRQAVIGKGLYIGHFSGITVSPCEIGECCSIHQHVKIGAATNLSNGEFPHIGSCVWIGPHARITGNITIGDNSTISAGAIVTEDINANNLVAGEPARVISTVYNNHLLLNEI